MKQVTNYYVCTKCGKACDVENAVLPLTSATIQISKCCKTIARIQVAKD